MLQLDLKSASTTLDLKWLYDILGLDLTLGLELSYWTQTDFITTK